MAVTRRHLLAASASIAAAAIACTGGICLRWWDAPPGAALSNLADEEAAFMRALSGAAFPAGDVIALSGAQADLDIFFDAVLSGLPELTSNLLKLLIEALQHLTLPRHGARFTALSPEAQQVQLSIWLDSDQPELRGAVLSLVVLLAMGYTTHPKIAPLMSTWHGCGYGR